ncbi:hypothetical protein GEMRC1_002328 [Eukaryota sp. GEM-RC1]
MNNVHSHFLSVASSFDDINTLISSSISSQLSKVRKDLEKCNKKLKSDHQAVCKDIAAERHRLEQLRQSYVSAATIHERASYDAELSRLQLVPDEEVSRKVKQANDTEKVLHSADSTYRLSVERVRALEETNEEVTTRVLAGHQGAEQSLLLQTRAWLSQLSAALAPVPDVWYTAVKEIAKEIDRINVDQEISDFVERHKTNALKPQPITYVPYMPSLGTPCLMDTLKIDGQNNGIGSLHDSSVGASSDIDDVTDDETEDEDDDVGGGVVVKFGYTADESDELTVTEGERVQLIGEESGGWIKVASGSGQGLVPFAYLEL